MKKILLFILLSVFVAGAAYAQKKEKKLSEKELKTAQAVAKKMLDKDLVMYMSVLIHDYGKVALDGNKVSLVDDKFSCNLPYQGSSRINTYGSQDISITADNAPVEVDSFYNDKKGFYKLTFSFKSSYDSERFSATLKVFLSGKVTLDVSSSERGNVKYQGGLLIAM